MSQQINLYNPQFEHQKQIFTARSMAFALGALALGLTALVALAEVRVARVQADVNAGAARLVQAQKRLAQANEQFAPRPRDANLATELQDAEGQQTALQHVGDLIAHGDLGDTHGYAEYFRALARQNVDGLWLTGVTVAGAGNEIGVRGRALDPALVPGYLARLRNEPVLQGKVVGSMQIAQAAPVKVHGADGKDSESPAPYVEFSLQSTPPATADANPASGGPR